MIDYDYAYIFMTLKCLPLGKRMRTDELEILQILFAVLLIILCSGNTIKSV